MTEPSPILTRRSDSTPKAPSPLGAGATLMQTKATYDRAIADYNEAIRLDPKSALAFRNRGIAYAYKGDHDRAIADYSEAIRLDPKSALAFSHRGVSYAYKGDNDRAIVDYNEAIRLDPNNALAFCNRGRAKRNINDMSGNADIAKSYAARRFSLPIRSLRNTPCLLAADSIAQYRFFYPVMRRRLSTISVMRFDEIPIA